MGQKRLMGVGFFTPTTSESVGAYLVCEIYRSLSATKPMFKYPSESFSSLMIMPSFTFVGLTDTDKFGRQKCWISQKLTI